MRPLREIRKANLALLVEQAGGQQALADKLGKDKNQVYQWGLPATNDAARNMTDRTARAIEGKLGLSSGWLDHQHESAPPRGFRVEEPKAAWPSHPGGLDAAKLDASIKFLEKQFFVWDRDFVLTERLTLVAAVYDRLSASEAPNWVELSHWLADQLKAEDEGDDRQSEAGSTGEHDRKRAAGGSR